MASLLVIGGSGFFGKSILDAFQRNLLDLWGIDSLIIMARHPEELQKNHSQLITSKVKLLKGDITSINELPFANYVIHAAASTDARNYLTSPLEERSNIIAGTLNYCDLAKKFHKKTKIVYVSSGAVYGSQPNNIDRIPEDFNFLDADQLPDSKRDYAYAKRDSEKAIIALGSENSLDVSIARCFAFVGHWLPLNQHFAIGNFINDGLHNRKIKVNTTQKVYRSYMYADDLVEWLMTIAEKSNPSCPIYNVGSDQEILINDLALKIGNLFNQEVDCGPFTSDYIDRYIPDISKAKKELNLNLEYDLIRTIITSVERIRS
ncbi:NAD-dependent epimerase/dehydratase family protein [Candidatus Methylopumilus planktonicus]|uniref:NAD-dependent epimerase/dehydratase family protein n=1 Tax=Candidatus Methylopumilus planktonicus TaxID=1581557 RepID=UPI003BEEF3DB